MDKNDKREYLIRLCENAEKAQRRLALTSEKQRNNALCNMADALIENAENIISSNIEDVKAAKSNGMTDAKCDRLKLDDARIKAIADAIKNVASLADPLSDFEGTVRPSGIEIRKTRVPLGNIAMIYEARPNVTADAAALCIKSGNAVILRGGKEALNTNTAIVNALKSALSKSDLSEDLINLISDTTRESTEILMTLRGYVDLLIPRGSAALIRNVTDNAKVPVIETGAGNCHVYIDKYADIQTALKVALSAKISRPSVCNAEEKLLVHKDIAESFLPEMIKLFRENGVEVRGDAATKKIIPDVIAATESDLTEEYDNYIITVYTVDGIDEAIAHINKYNTGHSEAIITTDMERGARFQDEIDAAAVYVNASTRFTDGGEFGLGAEIGISTQKLHTRGPFALEALTTVKYKINGNGNIR